MNGWLTTLLNRQSVDWWDLLDILIVSVLIYEVLKLIRGTRAVQMAVGTALVAGLFYASQWSRLETVNWLIRNAAGYLVFGFIVLFQSDLRRALAHLGRAPFFRYLRGRKAPMRRLRKSPELRQCWPRSVSGPSSSSSARSG